LLVCASPLFSAQYYIANWGSDLNSGSELSPFASISHAAELLTPGDTVSVFSGVYYESITVNTSGTQEAPILFRALPGEDCTIKAQQSNGFYIPFSVNYIIIEGFNITQAYPVGDAHGAGVKIMGNFCSVINNHIYNNHMGVFIENFTIDTTIANHDNLVFGNIFSDNGEAAVRIKRCDNNVVTSNLFYHNGYTVEPAGAVTFYGADSTVILNNTFWDNAGPAIDLYNGTDIEGTPPCTNSLVANNIATSFSGVMLIFIEKKMTNITSNEFSHNIWYNGTPGSKIISWGLDEFGQVEDNLTLTQFQEIAGELNPNNGAGSMDIDPLFENPYDLKFDLLLASPARDAGKLDLQTIGIENLTAFIDQQPDTGNPDLGYHHIPEEYSVNPPLITENSSKIFPNPSNGSVRFDIQFTSSRYPILPSVIIYNILGQKVTELQAPAVDKQDHFVIDWNTDHQVTNGVYIAVMEKPRYIRLGKFIILK